jgi:ribonuclease inhibitor
MKNVSINISDIKSIEELHQLLKSKLDFPAFYGMNWDAFRDSITGLVQMPDGLEIIGLEQFSKTFPKDAQIFIECLNDYNDQPDLKELKIVVDR